MLTLPRWLANKANTSGTTGTPLTAYHSYKAIRLEQAYIWVCRKYYGFIFGQKLASLRGNLGADQLSTYVPVSNTLYLSSYQISDPLAAEYHSIFRKFSPKAIEGYPSSLYNLALALKGKGLSLDIPLAFTSSETLFPFQRKLIEEVFNTEVFDKYGCTERSVSFSEKLDHKGYYEDPGYSHTELFDDYIVTTSFINDAFPLIRYRVDDVLRTDMAGNVISVDGRNEDVVVCKNGVKVGRLDHILKDVEGVSIAQIIQKAAGAIEINIVPDELFHDSTIRQVEDRLYQRIEKSNIDVKFSTVDKDGIEYSSRNKFSFVKSYVE
jgi:phenylacetate-CoA ligase